MNCALLSLVLAGTCAAPAPAPENGKYTIKLKNDTKGDVLQFTDTDAESGKTKITIMGKVQPTDQSSNVSVTCKEEILEKESGKKAAKLKVVFEKAEAEQNGKKLNLSLIGKQVIVVRDGNSIKFTIDGKAAAGDDEEFLKLRYKRETDQDPEIEKMIMPKEAVPLNGSWKLDMDALSKELPKEMPFAFDPAKSSGSGKLLKAYMKDGKQFGAFEVEMTMALTKVSSGPAMIDLDNNSNVKFTIKFDGCIDGSLQTGEMTTEMEMKMSGAVAAPDGSELKLDINAAKKVKRTQQDLTGKK
jgi:hypothetical protein